MSNEQRFDEIKNLIKAELPEDIEESFELLLNAVIKYSIERNHSRTNWTARELLESIASEETLKLCFDEHTDTAAEHEKATHERLKTEKYQKMIDIQQTKINESMQTGKKSVIWIFSDKGYYHNDFEMAWFEEFETKAREHFEKAGHKIKGIVITW